MEMIKLNVDGTLYETKPNRTFLKRKTYIKPNYNAIIAPIPGTCISVEVVKGQKVKRGDILVLFNAMKMHNRIAAPKDGTIKVVSISNAEVFKKGQVLLEIE